MGFMANMANDSERIDAMGADNAITELTPDGLFSGTVGAVAGGVVGGATAVGRLAYDALSGLNKSTELTYDPSANVRQTLADSSTASPQMDEALKSLQEWSKIDPRTAGVGAQTLGSLAHGATVFGLGTLAGGPVAGAATMGTTEGYGDYRDSIAAGVDPTAAMEKATATGLFAAAGAALPFKFGAAGVKGLIASVAGGASVNTGFGVANRFLSSEILSANGYKDMAEQYRPLDQQAMLADAILGAAFGGFAHLTHGADVPAAKRPTDDMVEQALDARRNDAVTRAGPGIPIDPQHSTLDGDLQDRALGNLLRGKPADISADEADAVVGNSIADPERVQLAHDYNDANLEVHGEIADFSEPARAEPAPAPYALDEQGAPITKPEAPTTAAAPSAEPAAKISPIAQEQLNQLALRHPDMDVQGPDGTTIKARDLPQALADHAEKANALGKLHDVAMACFMRTM